MVMIRAVQVIQEQRKYILQTHNYNTVITQFPGLI